MCTIPPNISPFLVCDSKETGIKTPCSRSLITLLEMKPLWRAHVTIEKKQPKSAQPFVFGAVQFCRVLLWDSVCASLHQNNTFSSTANPSLCSRFCQRAHYLLRMLSICFVYWLLLKLILRENVITTLKVRGWTKSEADNGRLRQTTMKRDTRVHISVWLCLHGLLLWSKFHEIIKNQEGWGNYVFLLHLQPLPSPLSNNEEGRWGGWARMAAMSVSPAQWF